MGNSPSSWRLVENDDKTMLIVGGCVAGWVTVTGLGQNRALFDIAEKYDFTGLVSDGELVCRDTRACADPLVVAVGDVVIYTAGGVERLGRIVSAETLYTPARFHWYIWPNSPAPCFTRSAPGFSPGYAVTRLDSGARDLIACNRVLAKPVPT